MIQTKYRNQTALLVRVIPVIEKEPTLAMHGGTAINLFLKELPRLSVDIDLTYVLFGDRVTALASIDQSLKRIEAGIRELIPAAKTEYSQSSFKLYVTTKEATVKLEVNTVTRGTLGIAERRDLCQRAIQEFAVFVSMPIVPEGQLYGGKIVAALDRQHPRDIFDVRDLLVPGGFTQAIKQGFLLRLLGGTRPPAEVLAPNFLDQRHALENQFSGMTNQAFTYEEYEMLRLQLKETVESGLTTADLRFIKSFEEAKPDLSIYDFSAFPAVKWRLKNLKLLQENNPEKFEAHLAQTAKVLNKIAQSNSEKKVVTKNLLEKRAQHINRGRRPGRS